MATASRPRILLLDPAFAAVPIHTFLSATGSDVWVMGNRETDPLVVARPDRWIHADYSKPIEIQKAIEQLSIDYVVPGCTDVSMASFAALNFDGPYRYSSEIDLILNSKNYFRQLCQELDLPSPRVVSRENLPDGGKFICKPVDSFSGRGVSIFDASNPRAVETSFELAYAHSKTSHVICEEFVTGQLYSYSAFLKNRLVDDAFVVREGSRYDPYAVDTSYVREDYSDSHCRILKQSVERIADHLDLCDGLVHLQFIADSNKLSLLEITRRCPGDLYSLLIEYSTGYQYAAKYASYFLGESFEAERTHKRYILRHTVKQQAETFFDGYDFKVNWNICRLIPLRTLGERIGGTGFQRTALLFAEEPSIAQLMQKYDFLTVTST